MRKGVGRARLHKVIDMLETADLPGEFNLNVLAEQAKNGRPACGTAACALGWATTIPSFRAAGLTLDYRGRLHLKGANGLDWRTIASQFFDIDHYEAGDLFYSTQNASDAGKRGRKKVVSRIKKLLRSQEYRARQEARP